MSWTAGSVSIEVAWVISPFVRRRRLASELAALREEHGYTSTDLAKAVGVARQSISRLEHGHVRPDLDVVMRVLDLFGVDEVRWTKIMTIAREAQERGWWEKYNDQMGPRQALFADLEAGAATIREYQMTLLPGLLQVPPYTEARIRADRDWYPRNVDPELVLQARAARQRMLERPGGPDYEVVIDEVALRRLAAPGYVVAIQLDHLVDIGHHRDKITVRVLPLSARIPGNAIPRSAFSIYSYPDPGDPTVVVVDTITSDLVLVDSAEVTYYTDLYERLRQAALTPTDSLDFLTGQAEQLARAGSFGASVAAD